MKKFYEKDLEEIIYNASDEQLEERGLYGFYGKRFRQLNLESYGKVNLVTASRDRSCANGPSFLRITIYVLKEGKIGVSSFFEAIKYAKGIYEHLSIREIYRYTINIVIIGSEVDITGSLCFIPSLFNVDQTEVTNFSAVNSIKFLTYDYDMYGIRFEESEDHSYPI
jgi:hypothetical protein